MMSQFFLYISCFVGVTFEIIELKLLREDSLDLGMVFGLKNVDSYSPLQASRQIWFQQLYLLINFINFGFVIDLSFDLRLFFIIVKYGL